MNHTSEQSRALVAGACTRPYHYQVFDEDCKPYSNSIGDVLFTRAEAELLERILKRDGLFAEVRDLNAIPAIKRRDIDDLPWGLILSHFIAVAFGVAVTWLCEGCK